MATYTHGNHSQQSTAHVIRIFQLALWHAIPEKASKQPCVTWSQACPPDTRALKRLKTSSKPWTWHLQHRPRCRSVLYAQPLRRAKVGEGRRHGSHIFHERRQGRFAVAFFLGGCFCQRILGRTVMVGVARWTVLRFWLGCAGWAGVATFIRCACDDFAA